MSNAEFNLIDKPWIRARSLKGEIKEYSILDIFDHASELQSMANDLPTQDFAILRVLLAIFQRSLSPLVDDDDDPAEVWESLWNTATLPMSVIQQYLKTWHKRFDLLDPEVPFMQLSGMKTKNGKITSVEKIIADVPDNKRLFALRSTNNTKQISNAEAARWVVHTQAFDTAGIKTGVLGDSKTKNGKYYGEILSWGGAIGGVYIEGENLHETLLLNLILCANNNDYYSIFPEDDLPSWERDPARLESDERDPSGRIDVYTWQSRRILLHSDNGKVDGVILTHGDRITSQNRMLIEPMTGWRRSGAQEKKLKEPLVYMPAEHQPDKALWRGLASLLPTQTVTTKKGSSYLASGVVEWLCYLISQNSIKKCDIDRLIAIHAVGFQYGEDNSKYIGLINDKLNIHASLLSPSSSKLTDLACQCAIDTDKAVSALGGMASNLCYAAGGSDKTAKDSRNTVKADAYFEIDQVFRRWLLTLQEDMLGNNNILNQARISWHKQASLLLLKIADSLIENASSSAYVGHKVQKKGWMTLAKAQSIFMRDLFTALPLAKKENRKIEEETELNDRHK